MRNTEDYSTATDAVGHRKGCLTRRVWSVNTVNVVNLRSHGAYLMNSAQATLPPRGISQRSDDDRNSLAVSHDFVARSSGSRARATSAWTPTARPSSRWETTFYPAALLPTQFFTDPGRTSDSGSGAQRLMFAVLQDAVACWFRYADGKTAKKQRLFQETYAWFWAQTAEGLYAFANICEVLKLDPDYIRRGLMRWHPSVQPPQNQPSARRPYVLTRRAAIPHASVLHTPQHATTPKKSKW